jgi:hypothetical protein
VTEDDSHDHDSPDNSADPNLADDNNLPTEAPRASAGMSVVALPALIASSVLMFLF